MEKADIVANPRTRLAIFLVATFLAGCTTSWDQVVDARTYEAYGKTWKYVDIRHHSSGWGFNTPHGIIGKVSKISQTAYLTADNEKISVNDRIFALQKDGSYKKASCCDHSGAFIDLFQLEGKLILRLMQTRENVTDCWAYPAGMSIDYMASTRKVYRIDFFGNFDPETKRFEIRDFISDPPTQKQIDSKYGFNPDRNQAIELTYSNRRPLICDEDALLKERNP